MKTLSITNVVAQPSVNVEGVGGNLLRLSITDGQGGEANLTMPRSNARNIANALNGIVNAQIRAELEAAEAAGTLTEAQAKRLNRIRETAERTAQLNAERSAAAKARKANDTGASSGRKKAA